VERPPLPPCLRKKLNVPQDNKSPHPESNPIYSKADYIRNAVFAIVKMELALYIGEGASVPEAVKITRELQQCVQRAYHVAVQEAAYDVGGPFPQPPEFGADLSDDNPFYPGDEIDES